MKKCPFCNAEIEENAHFCLYCMTSLEEKEIIEVPKDIKKRWPIILAAVLMIAFFILTISLLVDGEPSKKSPQDTPLNAIEKDSTKNTKGKTPQDSLDSTPDKQSDMTENSDSTEQTEQKDISVPSQQGNRDTTNDTNANSQDQPSSDPDKNTDTTTPSTNAPNSVIQTVTYLYRDAKYGDDFSTSANLENAVVITGVSSPSANGEYIIPATIDDKKVVAIMGLAFCDDAIKSTVKRVTVPASVKTIWGNAFATCNNLTDIYFCGKSIYVENNAFAPKANRNDTLTIHCSNDCSDRNYRYYKNSAVYYDAQYKEWNY